MVKKLDLNKLKKVLEDSLDDARGVLIDHDTNLGRTTKKNYLTAMHMENHIQTLMEFIDQITAMRAEEDEEFINSLIAVQPQDEKE